MNVFGSRKHSHDRENQRRRRQILKGMIRVTAIFLLFHTWPACSSETSVAVVSSATHPIVLNDSESVKVQVANVRVEVENLNHSESYTEIMPVGSTTSDALALRHKVTHGKICADQDGVVAVDGVGDFTRGDYWIVSVNGDYVNTNSHTQIKSGDQVKWQHLKTEI